MTAGSPWRKPRVGATRGTVQQRADIIHGALIRRSATSRYSEERLHEYDSSSTHRPESRALHRRSLGPGSVCDRRCARAERRAPLRVRPGLAETDAEQVEDWKSVV